MTPRKTFDNELNMLHEKLIYLSHLVEDAIEKALQALTTQDVSLAKQIIKDDDIIDAYELEIERKCLLIIATQQPIASDLRNVSSSLKILTDLERIGDHASDIADLVIRLSTTQYHKPLSDITTMANKAKEMLGNAIKSYLQNDLALSQEVCESDDIVDRLFSKITLELISTMKTDTNSVDECIDLMLITKYLERIADHATNIAEWAYFNATGEHTTSGKLKFLEEE